MAINLHSRYEKKIQEAFAVKSLVAGRFSDEYDYSGVKTVKVSTPQTVPMVNYTRSGLNRYGTPVEMQDVVQELTLTQDKAFALTIDKGNNEDQSFTKNAGKMLALQIKERAIPTFDKYCFEQMAQKAGTIVANATALSKTNVADRVGAALAALDDAEVPQENRHLFVPASVYNLLRLSPEWVGVDSLGEEALKRGAVGTFMGAEVTKVPSGRWPANVNFIAAYKYAATAPVKFDDTKLHRDPPGISGALLEGRHYYDFFVFGAKANGIYVEVNTAAGAGSVLAAPTIAAQTGAITTAAGATAAVYTTDGSDPRYSSTAKVGTAPVVTSGMTVKAYQYQVGAFPSPVAVQVIS